MGTYLVAGDDCAALAQGRDSAGGFREQLSGKEITFPVERYMRIDALLTASPQPPAASVEDFEAHALDYVPGELDRTAPERIWLQIDTDGDNASRDESWPGSDGVTWHDEQIGGLEIEYIRADAATLHHMRYWCTDAARIKPKVINGGKK